MSYVNSHLRSTFITLKINDLNNYDTITIEKAKCYEIKNGEEKMQAYYLGAHCWLINIENGFQKIAAVNNSFVEIKPTYFTKMKVKEIDIPQSIRTIRNGSTYRSDIRDMIDDDMETHNLLIKREEEIEMITDLDLGKKWVDTITYYYFTGGEFKWPELNITTFENLDSIKKLAIARKDNQVLEMLKAGE
jgi:hypothetical protein